MSQFKVVFLGTPDFAVPCLEKLIEDDHFDVVGVVTQPDRPAGRSMKLQKSPVKILSENHGIKVLCPENIKEELALTEVKNLHGEAAVVVAYGQILSRDFLQSFGNRVVNVHASLLPRWRGAAPIQRAIMAGDVESGVSLQVVAPKLDSGAVLGVRKCPIDPNVKTPELMTLLRNLAPQLIEVEFADWLRGHLPAEEQDEKFVTFAPKIQRAEGEIKWEQPASKVYNQFRGLFQWPGCTFLYRGKKFKLLDCLPILENTKAQPGEVIRASPQSLRVACLNGQLELMVVQPESRSPMAVGEFVRGYQVSVGERLGTS